MTGLLSAIERFGYRSFPVAAVILLLFSSFGFSQQRINGGSERIFIGKNGELRSKSIDRKKKQFKYDDGGTIVCYSSVFRIKRAQQVDDPCQEKLVRDFIWEHLQDQRRGHIRITYVGIDSGTHEYFFIEPDKDGKWSVSWWSVGYSALPPGRIRTFPKRVLFVERINAKTDGYWSLRFTDKDGVNFLNMPVMLREN